MLNFIIKDGGKNYGVWKMKGVLNVISSLSEIWH